MKLLSLFNFDMLHEHVIDLKKKLYGLILKSSPKKQLLFPFSIRIIIIISEIFFLLDTGKKFDKSLHTFF